MQKDKCFNLGHVSKLNGFKGRVMIFLDVDDPNYYKKLDVMFIDMNGGLVPFFLEEYQLKQKGFALVKFEGVDSEHQAKALLRKQIYLPEEALPKLQGNQFYFHEVKGFTIVDVNYGKVGEINQVLDFSNNPIFEILIDDKEVMIPASHDIIKGLDRENKTFTIDAPDGLIEMYLGTQEEEEEDDSLPI